MWYGEVQTQLAMFWQWMYLLDVPLQCWYICVCTRAHPSFLICVCTIVPNVCTEPAESVKIRARLGLEILSLIEGVRGRIPPQLNYTIWHTVSSYHSFMVELLKESMLLMLHLKRNIQLEFPAMGTLKRWEVRNIVTLCAQRCFSKTESNNMGVNSLGLKQDHCSPVNATFVL